MTTDSGDFTAEDLLAETKPREKTVWVLLRQDLIDDHAALDAELQRAMEQAGESMVTDAPRIAEEILALQAEMEAAKRPFTFRTLGRKRWRDLLAEHPPTKAQIAQARAQGVQLDHDPDAFQAAAIQASCIAPKMTLLHAHSFNERMDLAEWNTLWGACLEVNVGGGGLPKSLTAGRLARVSEELGLQRITTDSLDLSSLVGLSET